jgi:hypothetical protein
MAWDLTDARCWAPLFTPQHRFPGAEVLPSLQAPIAYRAPSARMAWALESEISAHLSGQLRAWRPRFVTRIRGDMTLALKALLYELEARSLGYEGPAVVLGSEGRVQVGTGAGGSGASGAGGFGGMRASSLAAYGAAQPLPGPIAGAMRDLSAEHQAVLERAASSRFRAVGFPLHASFTDMQSLCEAVRATDLHRIEHEGVQYALAVAVCPYANGVFSVWIYVVALLPHMYAASGLGPTAALGAAAAAAAGGGVGVGAAGGGAGFGSSVRFAPSSVSSSGAAGGVMSPGAGSYGGSGTPYGRAGGVGSGGGGAGVNLSASGAFGLGSSLAGAGGQGQSRPGTPPRSAGSSASAQGSSASPARVSALGAGVGGMEGP